MRTVYVPEALTRRSRFHRSTECHQLKKCSVQEISLDALSDQLPCKSCFQDAPVLRSAHRYCYICNPGKTAPCEHNGGVRVPMTRHRRSRSPYMDLGETYTRYQYVWPERAQFFLN